MNVDEQVIARDLGCCVRCGKHVAHLERGFAWSIHHRRPRGKGGTSLAWVGAAANLIVLCGSGTTGCHGWIESHRADARADGHLVPLNGIVRADEVAVRHAGLGLVLLTDEGGWRPVEEGPTPESMEGEGSWASSAVS